MEWLINMILAILATFINLIFNILENLINLILNILENVINLIFNTLEKCINFILEKLDGSIYFIINKSKGIFKFLLDKCTGSYKYLVKKFDESITFKGIILVIALLVIISILYDIFEFLVVKLSRFRSQRRTLKNATQLKNGQRLQRKPNNDNPRSSVAVSSHYYGQGPPPTSSSPSAPSLTIIMANTRPPTALKNFNDDCKDYFAGHCTKGISCNGRHSKAALGSTVQCPEWYQYGYCERSLWSTCSKRHSLLQDIYNTSIQGQGQDKNKIPPPTKEFQNHPEIIHISMKKVDVKAVNLSECPICLEEFSEIKRRGKGLVSFECGHVVCQDCSETRIIGTEKLCPICRKQIVQKPRVLYMI